MSGVVATETLPVFMKLKVKGFMSKERKEFLAYSDTFNIDVKEPELKFERQNTIRLLPSPLKIDTLSTRSGGPDSPGLSSHRLKTNRPNSSKLSPNKPSHFKFSEPQDKQFSPDPKLIKQQEKPATFGSKLDGILKSCSKLNRAMYHVERRLARTENKYFDTMTNLLVKTKKGPVFKGFQKDPAYMEKKRQMQEDIERAAQLEKEKKEPFREYLTKSPQKNEEAAKPAIDRVRSASNTTELAGQTSRQEFRLNLRHVIPMDSELASPTSPKINEYQITGPSIPLPLTETSSPRRQTNPRKTYKFPSTPKAESPHPRFVTDITEEGLYKELEAISKEMPPLRSHRSRGKGTMKLETYAIQDEDFLKFPTPKLKQSKSTLTRFDASPIIPFAKGSSRSKKKKKSTIKQQSTQKVEEEVKEEKLDPSKVILIQRDRPRPPTLQTLVTPNPNPKTLTLKSYLNSHPDSHEDSPLMRYLQSLPTQEKHYRSDTVPDLIERIEATNRSHFPAKKRKSETIATERLLSGLQLTPKTTLHKFNFPRTSKNVL